MFSDPKNIVKQLDIQSGWRIADFGAGVGHFAKALSPLVGLTGKIYAIEVQKEVLGRLGTDAEHGGMGNIEPVWGNIEVPMGTRLRDSSIDMVLVANVLFQSEHRAGLLVEAKRVLHPGGKIVVIDWQESFGSMGPQPGDVVNQAEAEKLLKEAGFTIDKTIDAGAHHYGIIAHK